MNRYIIQGVNPVPWKAPTVGWMTVRGRRIPHLFSPAEMTTYKDAIKESLAGWEMHTSDELSVTFYFWRNAGTKHDHNADATNLQKATEDALQKVLFPNDRAVKHVESWIMAQGPDVTPLIIIDVVDLGARPADVVELALTLAEPKQSLPDADFDVEGMF